MPILSKPISPLFLGSDWKYDPHGIALVNKMFVEDINDLSREIPIRYAVLKEESSITAADRKDAEKFNVQLVGADLPLGTKKPLDFDSMNINTGSFYHHLESIREDVTHIIGHVPKLSYAPFNFKKTVFKKTADQGPNIVLVIHDLPKDSDGTVQDDDMEELLNGAALVLSLGRQTYHTVEKFIRAIDKKPKHVCYIPCPPIELMQIEIPKPVIDHAQGPQIILLYSNDFLNIDFDLVVASTTMASDIILQNANQKDHITVELQAIKDSICKEDMKAQFERVKKETEARHKKLKFTEETVQNKEKMNKILKRSNLCVFPARMDSSVLGLEALMAAYSGLPVLVSDNTGAAGIFDTLHLVNSVVKMLGDFKDDAETWANKIVSKLKDPRTTLAEAKNVRETLLLDSAIPTSHLEFLAEISNMSCLEWKVDLLPLISNVDVHDVLLKDFGIPALKNAETIQEYIVKIVFYMLQQRAKIYAGLLNPHLPKSLLLLWKEFLKLLEAENRKVINIRTGSLIIVVFCPTDNSRKSLKTAIESKKFTLQNNLERLLREIIAVCCITEQDAARNEYSLADYSRDEFPVKETAEYLVKAILAETSGLIPGPEFDPSWPKEREKNMNSLVIIFALAQRLQLPRANLAFLAGQALISSGDVRDIQQVQKRFEIFNDDNERIACDVLDKAVVILKQVLQDDRSHYLCSMSLPAEWSTKPLIQLSTIRKIMAELLPAQIDGKLLERMVTVCADDPNWNIDENPPEDEFLREMISLVGRKKCAIELSNIVLPPHSNMIQNTVKEAIITQDGTDIRWALLSNIAVENLCRTIRHHVGLELITMMKHDHNSAIQAKIRRPITYVLRAVADVIVDICGDVFTGLEQDDVEKMLQALEEEQAANISLNEETKKLLEKRMWPSLLAKIMPLAISNYVLLQNLDMSTINVAEAVAKEKTVQYAVSKVKTKLQTILSEKSKEQRKEPNKDAVTDKKTTSTNLNEMVIKAMNFLTKFAGDKSFLRAFFSAAA